MEEIWKEYKTKSSHLFISNLGNVEVLKWDNKRVETKDVIKIIDGRRCIGAYPIYKLVDDVFRGYLPKGYVVHHKDFNKLNDSLNNLVRLESKWHAHIHATNRSKESKNKMSNSLKNRHWYNNGKSTIRAYECPEGFTPGRVNLKKILSVNINCILFS